MSQINPIQSQIECINVFRKNFDSLCPKTNWKKMFYQFKTPKRLFVALKTRVSPALRVLIQESWNLGQALGDDSKIVKNVSLFNPSLQFLEQNKKGGIRYKMKKSVNKMRSIANFLLSRNQNYNSF